MTTAIIGLGNMGQGLARRLAGHTDLVLATRNAADATELAAALPGARAASVDAAIAAADVVILAVGYEAALELAARPELAGKVVVDITNPVEADYSGLRLGHTTSAAEEIQKVAPRAQVVKAFNTVFAQVLQADGKAAGRTATVFVAGDDPQARATVVDLVTKAGFETIETGGLASARLLEPLGMLNITLGYGQGLGTDIAPTWLRAA